MASKGNIFSKILTFFLVIIIIGGIGFLGYNMLPGIKDSMSGINTGGTTSGTQANSQYSTATVNAVLQNKDNLDKVLETLKDSITVLTLDPYGVQPSKNNSGNTNASSTQGNTTINIYPQTGTNQANSMQSMGITYDENKMQQLHTGLYKLSVGMQLLDQLKDNISAQFQQASMEVANPSQYYYNQYAITLQNKNKLDEALTYINGASALVNINPYISQTGVVYDKDKMDKVHDSIYKLAQAVINLNKIDDNLLNQAITLNNLTQSNLNNGQSMPGMNKINSGLNFFGSMNISNVLNVLIIIFIIIFTIAILGFISKMLKTTKKADHIEENNI